MSIDKTATQIMQEDEALLRRQRLLWAAPSFEEAMDRERDIRQATDFYRTDARARALIDSCVARAREMSGPIDPSRADRDANDLAVSAAAFMLAQVYSRDAELRDALAERDHFRKLAEQALLRGTAGFVARAT